MAILNMEGFESSPQPDGFYATSVSSSSAGVLVAGTGRWGGGASAYHRSNYMGAGGSAYQLTSLYGVCLPLTSLSWSAGIKFTAELLPPTSAATEGGLVYVTDDGPTAILEFRYLRTGGASGYLAVIVNGINYGATAAPVVLADKWFHLGFDLHVHESQGWFKAYVNGELFASASEINTKGASTGRVTRIGIGALNVLPGLRVSTPNVQMGIPQHNAYVDDWVLLDHTGPAPTNRYLGDSRIVALRPNAAGATSQWMGSDGNQVANWQLIDDEAGTADHIKASATALGARDLSEISEATLSQVETVVAVQIEALAAKLEAGSSAELLGVLRSGSGSEIIAPIATAQQLSTSYRNFKSPVLLQSPAGQAWSEADIGALQLGVQIGAQSEEV